MQRKEEKTMEQEKNETGQEKRERKTLRHATPLGENQKFIKNDQYFTICIYTFVLVVFCTIAIKVIISFDQTKEAFNGMFRAVGPFLIALLIAYILNPFVKAVGSLLEKISPVLRKRERVRTVIAMLIVYVLGLGMIIVILTYVLPEVVRNLVDLINQLPAAYKSLLDILEEMQHKFPTVDFSSIISMLESTQSDVTSELRTVAGDLIPVLYTASVSIVTWLGNFLIALIVSVYMLYGKQSLRRMIKIVLYAFVPAQKISYTKELVLECNNIFSKYLVSKMIDSFIIGVLCSILMTILKLPYVLLISVIVGITNMIPYFGPFIGAIPGIVIILCIDPIKALIFAVMILCLQQFDGLILGPKLLGDSTGMKPLWIIFAITIGGKFFGVIGMFLGVPVMATLGYLAERYMGHRLRRKHISMDQL